MTSSILPNSLQQRQNGDGGWAYNRGSSWTEPTALAVLALLASGLDGPEVSGGLAWLLARQRADGGWAPNDLVTTSCSVTNTCLLALGCHDRASKAYAAGLVWTLGQIKPDYTLTERAIEWWQGVPEAEANTSGGCPWFPGTAAWVAPTVMMTLALAQAVRLGYNDPNLAVQIRRSQHFLLSRRCPDGGWNHGGTQLRSPNSTSYPETTGMALLAFGQDQRTEVEGALQLAASMLAAPGSSEAQSWLSMALTQHRHKRPPDEFLRPHTARDLALQILAQADSANPLFV